MTRIWAEEHRLSTMLEVELTVCDVMADAGQVPQDAARQCRERAGFDVARVHELEKTLKHDVIAFLTAVTERVGEPARHLHKGMTSSDVLDTATALQYRDAGRLLLAELDRVLDVVATRAREHKDTVCVGRTHGIHAEPTTFGLKLLGFWDELNRGRLRLERAIEEVAVGKLSGAVGTYAFLDPEVEAEACRRLGLGVASHATQVVPRDRHAAFFTALALLASSIERAAVEIRHLQRTEVLEAEEPFTPGQKGSSAMPHKRNPIHAENLTGLARLVRSYAMPAMEDIALWHERDISHSSVERVIGPDATITLHFMFGRFAELMAGLVVYPERMRQNLDRMGGLVQSQRVLLALVDAGLSREEAYAAVQRTAMRVWAGEGTLRVLLGQDDEISSRLSPDTLDGAFDLAPYLRHRDTIFHRILGD